MAEQKIEFRKIRDFGENLNDSFVFIKQNYKEILASFFAICGMFLLCRSIFNGIYQSRYFGIFDQLRKGINSPERTLARIFPMEYFLTLLFTWLSYSAMNTVLGSYIKFYVENGGLKPTIEQIWELFKKYFLKILLYSVPVFLLTVVGFVFCLAPGVYLGVVLMPFSLVLIIEDADFGRAFSRCFEIISGNFWQSLAIYFVATIIYSFGGAIVSLVVGVIAGIAAFFTTNSVGTTAGIVTSIFAVFSSVFYIIFYVSLAFQYFNLVEKRDGTGILQRLETIGGDKNNFNNIEEQY
jgi:hypothetical protein